MHSKIHGLYLAVLIVLVLVTVQIRPAYSDDLIRAQAPLTRTKTISYMVLNFTFFLNGSISITNNFGDKLIIGRATAVTTGTITVSLWSNSSHVAYNVVAVFRAQTLADVWIYFDFLKISNAVKITISGTLAVSGSLTLPLTFPKDRFLDAGVVWSGSRDPYQPSLLKTAIGFSWRDSLGGSFNNATSLISWTAGQSFVIDPSVVAASTDSFANIWGGVQPKLWTGASRIWSFYSGNVSAANATLYACVRYNTSLVYGAGNPTWSSPFYFRAVNRAEDFAVYFNSSHFSFVYANTSIPATGAGNSSINYLYWKLYAYFSNGTIKDKTGSWVQVYKSAANATIYYPNTVISSDKTIYAGYVRKIAIYRNPFWRRNAWKNGSWSEDSNFQIGPTIALLDGVQPGHLLNGNLCFLYQNSSSSLWYCFYNGTSKALSGHTRIDNTNTYKSNTNLAAHNMVTNNDDVYITWCGRKSGTPVNYSVFFDFKNSARGFNATDERVKSLDNLYRYPVMTLDTTANKAYVFWLSAGADYTWIHYHSRDLSVNFYDPLEGYANNWPGSDTAWFDIVDPPAGATSRLNAIKHRYDSKFMIQYMNKSSSPYQICFNYFNATLKAWTLISTWTATLTARTWTLAATWTATLLTRSWTLISTWAFSILTRSWLLIVTWTFYFNRAGFPFWTLLAVILFIIGLGGLFVLKELNK